MNHSKKNSPAIRMTGFTGAWEQRKVSDMLIERSEQTAMNAEYPLMAFVANIGLTHKGKRYDRSSLIVDVKNKLYKKTEFGDFIYSSNNLDVGSIGLNLYGKACISPVYNIFQPTEIADYNFLGQILIKKDFINEMIKWRQGVIYGQWRIHPSDFLNIEIKVPHKKEQTQIGNFFKQLDETIALHKRMLEKHQNLKKFYLEKMFPKENQQFPEVRFPNFTDAWEQRKLGELAEKISRVDENSNAPIMMITANNGFINQSERYSFNNSGESLKKYILLKQNELAYNHGASKLRPYGSCFHLEAYEARIPFVYHCFSCNGNDPYFLSMVLNNSDVEKQLKKLISSGARQDGLLNISFEQYVSVEIKLPNKEEQTQIGNFFKQLDETITLHKRKVEKFEKIKQAYLEKMFI